jgi:MFS family permease
MKKNSSILLLLFTGVLMGALDISIVGPAIPSIEKTIRISERDLSWIFSIYVLFNLVGISLMARLSDYFGRRWIYILAVGIFGAGSLLVSLSHDSTLLLVGRAVQGFGSSGIFPVALAVIGDLFPVEKRGRALGLIGAVFGLAFIMGPFIAGFMLMWFDWNALFLVNIPVAILLILFSFFLLPSKPAGKKVNFDWEGIIILGVILAAFTLAINLLDTDRLAESLFSWPVLPLLTISILLIPILYLLEYKQQQPVFNFRLFNSRQIRLVGFIAFGLGLFQSSIVFLPTLAVGFFSVDPSRASFMLLPVVAATAVGSPVFGRIVDRIGSRIIVLAGLFLAGTALLLLGFLQKSTLYFYIAEGLLGLGLAMRASLNYIMLNEAGPEERASTQGVLLIFISMGQLAGAAMIGAVTSSVFGIIKGFNYSFLLMTVLAFLLFIVAFFLKKRSAERMRGDT